MCGNAGDGSPGSKSIITVMTADTTLRSKMTKSELRKKIKDIPLDAVYKITASEIIRKKVLSSEMFEKADTIFSYVSTDREPDTREIIKKALSLGKKVCVPKCREKPNMDLVYIDSLDCLSEASFGLMEPASGEKALTEDIDLAIIPCVSVTEDGIRLGHGGGYYDKFMENFTGTNMCLCFKKLMREDLPKEQHDINVNVVSD